MVDVGVVMHRSADIRRVRRAAAVPILAAVVLLIFPGVAAAAVDGVPLYPHKAGSPYKTMSMENADLSGPMLAFEAYSLDASAAAARSQTATIVAWNAASGVNWTIGRDGQTPPAGADQREPNVLDLNGDVYVAWQQLDPVTGTWDLWLWRGSEKGDPRAGYPMVVARGPQHSDQCSPDLGVTTETLGKDPILAWVDDRDFPGPHGQIYWMDMGADGDNDGVRDVEEPGFDPATVGVRLDPSGNLLKGQHDPAVGNDGIFWLDDRSSLGAGDSEVWRAEFSLGLPAGVQPFFRGPNDNKEKLQLRAAGPGAAWLGPGIAGGPWEPWAKVPGGEASIVTFLANPTAFDVAGTRFAVSAGHGGNTDGDGDIFLYDQLTGQSTPVCNVGGTKTFAFDRLKIQRMPSISGAAGGSRVVWSDSRQKNKASTPIPDLAYELYVALVPTVQLTVTRSSVKDQERALLKATVAPDFKGKNIFFQAGVRHVAPTAYGDCVWYTGWKTLKKKPLDGASSATYMWPIPKGGPYYVRAWFAGGTKYTGMGKRKVPHVPMASTAMEIVR